MSEINGYGLNDEEKKYMMYHRKRFAFLRKILDKYITGSPSPKVLEIGPWGIRTYLLYNECDLYTMGIYDPKVCDINKHFEVNLSTLPNGFPEIDKKFDIVICCEVIEHLPISMDTMYEFLNSLLNKKGILIIQTPNGVSLKNRMSMVLGKNPFPLIDKTTMHFHNHIREYTLEELKEFGIENYLWPIKSYQKNYFDYSHSWKAKLYEIISYILPSSLKDGNTVIYKKLL